MPRLSSLPASFLPKVQLRVWTNECPCDLAMMRMDRGFPCWLLDPPWCCLHPCTDASPMPRGQCPRLPFPLASELRSASMSQHLGVGQHLGSFLTNQAPLLSLLCPLPLRSPYVLKPCAHPVTLAHEDELINCLPHPLAHSPSPPGEAAGNSGLHPCHVWSCWIKCRMLVIFKFQINNK